MQFFDVAGLQRQHSDDRAVGSCDRKNAQLSDSRMSKLRYSIRMLGIILDKQRFTAFHHFPQQTGAVGNAFVEQFLHSGDDWFAVTSQKLSRNLVGNRRCLPTVSLAANYFHVSESSIRRLYEIGEGKLTYFL